MIMTFGWRGLRDADERRKRAQCERKPEQPEAGKDLAHISHLM